MESDGKNFLILKTNQILNLYDIVAELMEWMRNSMKVSCQFIRGIDLLCWPCNTGSSQVFLHYSISLHNATILIWLRTFS